MLTMLTHDISTTMKFHAKVLGYMFKSIFACINFSVYLEFGVLPV